MSDVSTAAAERESAVSQQILVFEFEGAAVNGRAVLFEAVKKIFGESGVKISETRFSRSCTQSAVPAVIEKLIAEAGEGKVPDEAAAKVFDAYVAGIAKAKVNPVFAEVIKESAARGISAFAITALPEDKAREAFAASGLKAELHIFPTEERHFPRIDCWMKVGREVGRPAANCIAIAGCRDSAKSALAAGMHSVVVPDAFTSYQDFGGSDAVLDNTEDYPVNELFDALT